MFSQCMPGSCGHRCPSEGADLHLASLAALHYRALQTVSQAGLTSAVMDFLFFLCTQP